MPKPLVSILKTPTSTTHPERAPKHLKISAPGANAVTLLTRIDMTPTLFSGPGPRRNPVGAAPDAELIPDPPTLADVHLVMNSLNQLAAHFHEKTQEEDPRLFAVADYLHVVFRDGNDRSVPVHEELELLLSYVRLVEVNRALAIAFAFTPGAEADDHADRSSVRVQRHLSCDLVAALLRSLPGDGARTAELKLSFNLATDPWAYDLRVSLHHDAVVGIAVKLRAEVNSLAERFGLESGAQPNHEMLVDDGALHWTVRVPRAGEASS